MNTIEQLKSALAKMLPETVKQSRGALRWNRDDEPRVLDTELLFLCSLVEAGLTQDECDEYHSKLIGADRPGISDCLKSGKWAERWTWHSSWRQRTTALAEVKNITV